MLKVASGMLTPRSGRILVDGVDVTRQGPQQMLRSGLAHVLQGHSVFREMTVGENVLLGAYTVRDKALIGERVDFVKNLFPVVASAGSRSPALLSGGQQKQVEFARSLMVSPKVVLLDEPSMGLDPKTTTTVFEQVVRMRDAGDRGAARRAERPPGPRDRGHRLRARPRQGPHHRPGLRAARGPAARRALPRRPPEDREPPQTATS